METSSETLGGYDDYDDPHYYSSHLAITAEHQGSTSLRVPVTDASGGPTPSSMMIGDEDVVNDVGDDTIGVYLVEELNENRLTASMVSDSNVAV